MSDPNINTEGSGENAEPRVTADHFEVVTAAIAARNAAVEENDAAYKEATEKLDELNKDIRKETAATRVKADGLSLTREAVRGAYHTAAKRIERDYRVAIYGEAQVLREEEEAKRIRRQGSW